MKIIAIDAGTTTEEPKDPAVIVPLAIVAEPSLAKVILFPLALGCFKVCILTPAPPFCDWISSVLSIEVMMVYFVLISNV